jgi:predicted transcriptional regulator
MAGWTFLTNHSHVLFCLDRDNNARLRDVAAEVGLTERAAQRIVSDLVEAGYLERHREGRNNSYVVHKDMPLRHPLEDHRSIGDILGVLRSRARRS